MIGGEIYCWASKLWLLKAVRVLAGSYQANDLLKGPEDRIYEQQDWEVFARGPDTGGRGTSYVRQVWWLVSYIVFSSNR